jgi:hypothetical protein
MLATAHPHRRIRGMKRSLILASKTAGKAVLSAALLTLTGCTPYFLQQRDFQARVNSHIGEPVSVVIEKLGLPTNEQTIGGHHYYAWHMTSGSSSTYLPLKMPGQKQPLWVQDSGEQWCEITYEVDQGEVILKGSFRGNDCR